MNPRKRPTPSGRRALLKTTTGLLTAAAAPLVLPSRARGAPAPSDRMRVEQIGCGRIAPVHDLPGVLNSNLAAVQAGKDVYVQKPFSLTHAESVLVRDAVRKSGRIVQSGSQQRSTSQFRRAAELARAGRIGAVRRVEVGLPTDPTQPDPPEQPVPIHLGYSAWLGPTLPERAPYGATRLSKA